MGTVSAGNAIARKHHASEVARRTPVPKGACDMLVIGGAHGYYSVAICRRHPGLRSIILALPDAIEYGGPILAKEGMGDCVLHRTGNAIEDDLGTDAYDLVFISNLIHHFDYTTNCDLFRRVAQCLRPGGYLVIQEAMIAPNELGLLGKLLELFFALTSDAGNWSFKEIANWQREAGLVPRKPIRFITAPGAGQQVAVKPSNWRQPPGGSKAVLNTSPKPKVLLTAQDDTP